MSFRFHESFWLPWYPPLNKKDIICLFIYARLYTIFKAFDREEEHKYEFQIGGKGPQDPKAKRYGLHEAIEDSFGERKLASDTPIESLNFKVGEPFGYWFDFGDDWWHQINVINIKAEAPAGKYPKVTKREGASPPQYEDLEE